nr:DUF5979 domain-containing protein [uncultured Faecalibacillus sp.]
MNIKQSIKKILACATASAMALCLTMPTAFADDTKNNATEAYISKTYNTEVGKAETFSFTATQVTGEGLVSDPLDPTMPSISFTADETGTKTKRDKITFPAFNQEGKYEYTVTESQTANPAVANNEHEKMIMSQAEYKMDVYVSNINNNYEITKIIVNKTKDDKGVSDNKTGKVDIGNSDANGFSFTNTYVQEAGTGTNPKNPDPDYTNYGSLNISKTIDANGGTADTTKQFDFTATFNFPAGTDKNTLDEVKGNGEAIEIDESGNCSFKLQHNKKMKFTGLPVGTKMTVTESATPNYKSSAKVTINGVEESKLVTASKYNEAIVVSNKRLDQKKNAVDVTNTYNNVPTTGIIMNTLPYVMMIALGGAALVGYIYLKRRKYSN